MTYDDWLPLSQRLGESTPDRGPYEGVPEWLQPSLLEWMEARFWSGPDDLLRSLTPPDAALIGRSERLLRIRGAVSPDPHTRLAHLKIAVCKDDQLFLNLVELLLSGAAADSYKSPRIADELEAILAEAGSVWGVVQSQPEGGFTLRRRVPREVVDGFEQATTPEDRISEHLRAAWAGVYNLNPNPTEGYDHSVKAVEAAAWRVVTPSDDKATLGKIISAFRDGRNKFEVVLLGNDEQDTHDAVVGMMRLLSYSKSRHGKDESVPFEPTPEEAEAALHLALTLVQWFRTGAIRRID